MADDKKVLSENNANEVINWGLWIASFVLPPLGYIFYSVWKKSKPRNSYSSGWGALWGFLFYVVGALVYILFIK